MPYSLDSFVEPNLRNAWWEQQCTSLLIPVYYSKSSKVNPHPRYWNAPTMRRSIGDEVLINHLPNISDEAITFATISLYSAWCGTWKQHQNFFAQRLLSVLLSLSLYIRYHIVLVGGRSFLIPFSSVYSKIAWCFIPFFGLEQYFCWSLLSSKAPKWCISISWA